MSKQKYVYNQSTLQYEKLKVSPKKRLIHFFGFLSLSIIFASVLFAFSSDFIPSPQEMSLQREIDQLNYNYTKISSDFDKVADDLAYLHQKDSDVHRVIFGLEPIDEAIWHGGTGGHDKYDYLNNFASSGEMIKASIEKVEKLKRQVEIHKSSLDTIYTLALEREEMLLSIPSIKPVREDKLKRKLVNMSGYGWRIHPVNKVRKFHKGIDFTAPNGTDIQATGTGIVKRVEVKKFGYGVNVIIDHGFGFQTLYAHMSKVDVKKGERVVRGQKIGEVGNTGTSTAPHLHYEVRKNGKAVNPIDYVLDGLTAQEYQELVEMASIENQSFD